MPLFSSPISASAFIAGTHCARRAWLLQHESGTANEAVLPPPANLRGLLRELFPGGVDAAATQPGTEDALLATRAAMEAGAELIYDAAFRYQDIFVTVDLLRKTRGRWYAYEAKIACSVKPAHLQHAALQHYVLAGAGLRLSGSYIVHLNKVYVRRGPLELDQLLVLAPVSKAVRGLQPAIESRAGQLRRLLAAEVAPWAATGNHCRKPGPCGFAAQCAAPAAIAEEPAAPIGVDRVALRNFLAGLRYPLHFLDFEAYQPPLPEYDGHWPFRQVPFQYSLHRLEHPGAPLKEHSFLAGADGDPAPRFLASLREHLGPEGSILVYGRSTEQTILTQLGNDYPGQQAFTRSVQERLVDLALPFLKKQVHLPALKGRSSLKAVLPALVPALSYEGLAIADGGDAHIAYAWLRRETDPACAARIRADLLAYCALDTLAMVRILERLYEWA